MLPEGPTTRISAFRRALSPAAKTRIVPPATGDLGDVRKVMTGLEAVSPEAEPSGPDAGASPEQDAGT